MNIGPLFAALAVPPKVEAAVETAVVEVATFLARPTGSREVVAPCGCRMRLAQSWVGELATTVSACAAKAAGKACAAGRGVWE